MFSLLNLAKMNSFFQITFFLSFGFLFSQNDTITKSVKLKEVIIDAAHIKSSRKDLPLSVTQKSFAFDQKNFKQESLDEYLDGVPGLFSQNANNFAQDLRLSIRGFGARSAFGIRGIKLIVDGIPETTPDGQGQVDNLPLGIINNVTILRGPASALYGNSSGGVIQIKTLSDFDKNFLRFRLQGGSFAFGLAQLVAGWKNKKTNLLIFQNLNHSNGFREFSSSRQEVFNAKITHEFSDKSKVNFQFNYTNSPYAYDPGGLKLDDIENDYNQARQRNIDFDTFESIKHLKAGINWERKLSSKLALETYFFSAHRDFQGKLPFEYGGFINLKRNYFGFGTNLDYNINSSHFLQLRFSISDQKDNRKRYKNLLGEKGENTLSQKELFYNSSISVLDQIKFDYGLLRIGIRYDHQKIRAKPDYESYNQSDNSIKLNILNPSVGFTLNEFSDQSIYGSFATSFETPTLSELSANPNGQVGFNKSLKSSLAKNFEIGWRKDFTDIKLEAVIFHISTENEILPYELEEFPGRTFYRNAGKTIRRGLEILGSKETDSYKAVLSYSFSDFIFDSYVLDGSAYNGNRLPAIPKHHAFFSFKYKFNSTTGAEVKSKYVGTFFADDKNSNEVDAYSIFQYRVWKDFKNYSLYAGANNLFNKKYFDNIRINAFANRFYEPAPHRNYYAGINFKI